MKDFIRRRADKLRPKLFPDCDKMDTAQAMLVIMVPLVTAVFFLFLMLPPSDTSDPLFNSFSQMGGLMWWVSLFGFISSAMIVFVECMAVKAAIETRP